MCAAVIIHFKNGEQSIMISSKSKSFCENHFFKNFAVSLAWAIPLKVNGGSFIFGYLTFWTWSVLSPFLMNAPKWTFGISKAFLWASFSPPMFVSCCTFENFRSGVFGYDIINGVLLTLLGVCGFSLLFNHIMGFGFLTSFRIFSKAFFILSGFSFCHFV